MNEIGILSVLSKVLWKKGNFLAELLLLKSVVMAHFPFVDHKTDTAVKDPPDVRHNLTTLAWQPNLFCFPWYGKDTFP